MALFVMGGLAACDTGVGYTVVADLGTALIVVANPTLGQEGLVAAARHACGERRNCQARVWTDRQWAPRSTDWPPGSRENIALILNRFPGEGSEYHRWNCRRYRGTEQKQCIPF